MNAVLAGLEAQIERSCIGAQWIAAPSTGLCGEKPSGLGSFPVMSCYVIAPCSATLPC
jgi:hypothetical protein